MFLSLHLGFIGFDGGQGGLMDPHMDVIPSMWGYLLGENEI